MALTTKQILHLNRGLAEIETNKNNEISYKLNNPIRLNEGDRVTLYKAFLNERGLSASTMSFNEDTGFKLKFHYWVPFDIRSLGTFDSIDYKEFLYEPKDFKAFSTGQPALEAQFAPFDYTYTGPGGHPCILYEVASGLGRYDKGTLTPALGFKTVYIKAGNYTTSSIANLIEAQMNGQNETPENNDFTDIYDVIREDDQIFTDQFYDKQPSDLFDGLVKKIICYDDSYNATTDQPNDFFTNNGTVTGYVFLPLNTHEYVKSEMNSGNYTKLSDIEALNLVRQGANNPAILPWLYRKFIDPANANNGDDKRSEGEPLVGAKAFEFQYSADTQNRFSFTGLHTPLQLQSHSTDSVVNPQAASVITQFNFNELNFNGLGGVYPVDSSSGISVLSFDWNLVVNYSDVYKTLSSLNAVEQDFLLFYSRHEAWFSNLPDIGLSLWTQYSVWPRFGFSFNQLALIENTVKSYKPFNQGPFQMSGFITGNDYNLSQGTAASGLGKGLKTSTGSLFQAFSTVNGFATSYDSTGKKSYSLATLSSNPKFYNAASFPDLLNNKSYYVIHSDIVTNNYLDPKAFEGTVVGFASFEQSTLDTIYSVEGVEFPVIQPKVLASVNVRITYPDGSDVPNDVLSADSGLVFIIEKPAALLTDPETETKKERSEKK